TFNQLSWIASANYAGYLAGSLLFSFGLFHLPSRLRPMLLASADHHLPGDTLPDAEAIINPNLRDCEFPSKSLAGVGVAFYLMLA
ncbi:YbfB/YjiJ family MFS transporter, partial [Salmonella enterica subsp. enterica serovar Kentucky]|nr:YbfB/YjiJ family MFS transporter [Salmonella enterica subsp. enterica serovar Kentucky]